MFPNYIIGIDTPGSVSELALHTEIAAAGPYDTNFIGVSVTGPALCIHFDAEPSETDILAVEGVLAAHDHTLAIAKAAKVKEIDVRTEALIDMGFSYAAKQFSLSIPSQSKMTAAHQLKDHVAFAYPVNWNTIDDADAYVIADAADMDAFYLTAIGTIRAHLDSGTSLKDSVRAATTAEEVDSVTDSR